MEYIRAASVSERLRLNRSLTLAALIAAIAPLALFDTRVGQPLLTPAAPLPIVRVLLAINQSTRPPGPSSTAPAERGAGVQP